MDEPTSPARAGHLRWLLVLLLIATGLRAWQLPHTEVMTRDGIAFAHYAWRLQHEPVGEVLRDHQQHPGYPAIIAAFSVPVRAVVSDDPRAMQLSAQLVSCLASVLLVFPMYFLGCEWFSRRVGFAATLLFQVLPASGRMMPDGLTEPLFLLFAASALLFASRGIRTGRTWCFLFAGLASGCAYLTRMEGMLLAGVTGLVLLGLQLSRRWQRGWFVAGREAAMLTAGALVVALPYMLTINAFTNKGSAAKLLDSSRTVNAVEPDREVAVAGLPFGAWKFGPEDRPENRYGWAAGALVVTLDRCFFHVLTLPFLAGLLLLRRRVVEVPALWLSLTLMGILLPLVYRLGQSNGYLGERHLMLVTLAGIYWAVAALEWSANWLGSKWQRLPASGWALAFLVVLVLVPLPKTLAPLHADRAGFRQAGEWLADHAPDDAVLIDPFAWSAYYSGRQFDARNLVPHNPRDWPKPGSGTTCYVVLDRSRSKHEHLWYILRPAEDLASRGEAVQRFPIRSRKQSGEVVVYRVQQ